ncbi:MAG: hypothetical protein GYA14_06795 [Ignavibacteria bacterium]|nr:hypothetical protein [Ignavibacteria bacterium]
MASYYHRETVFYDKCHHFGNDNIENDKCLKRYFDITEAHSDIVKRLIVCNEFIRLKISSTNIQSVINNKYGESIYFDRANYRHIIDDIVHEVFPPKHPLSCMETNMHRSIMNPVFDYVICERPYLMRGISLNDALRLILDYGWDNVNREFRRLAVLHLRDTCKNALMYKNIKRKKEEIMIISNQLKRGAIWGINYEQKLTTLLIDFLEIQSTFKL